MGIKTLVLGGTTEASMLARLLADDRRFAAVLSLAGVTQAPVRPPIPMRIGGFGGALGLAAYLRREAIDALVDATHPFAAAMSHNAQAAAASAGVPLVIVNRPGWEPRTGDRWTPVADMQAAAEALGRKARRVLLTVGRKDLAPFAVRSRHRFVVRSVDPPGTAAPARARIISARGPFELADELRLLQDQRIDILVTKNSGGAATYAKLAAARELGLPVIMVQRPAPPDAEVVVADAAMAWQWLERLHQAALSVPRGV